MIFRVGDRVRKVANRRECDFRRERATNPATIGAEGTVIELGDGEALVAWDRFPDPDMDGVWCLFYMLAPLTPPAQDEWAESKVREVTRPVYTEPERVKERA